MASWLEIFFSILIILLFVIVVVNFVLGDCYPGVQCHEIIGRLFGCVKVESPSESHSDGSFIIYAYSEESSVTA